MTQHSPDAVLGAYLHSETPEKILSPWVNTVGEIERHTWQDAAEQKSVS